MEIYLKHRERKQFVCIQSKDDGSCELDVFESMMSRDYDISYSEYEDELIDERHSWYSAQTDMVSINGRYTKVSSWVKSNKEEFMEAYKNAMNTLHTFQLQLNKIK